MSMLLVGTNHPNWSFIIVPVVMMQVSLMPSTNQIMTSQEWSVTDRSSQKQEWVWRSMQLEAPLIEPTNY